MPRPHFTDCHIGDLCMAGDRHVPELRTDLPDHVDVIDPPGIPARGADAEELLPF